jgi:hypothetical protein
MSWLVLALPDLRDDSLKLLRHNVRLYVEHRAASVDDPIVPVLQDFESGAALAKGHTQKALRPVPIHGATRHLSGRRYPQPMTPNVAD